MKKIALGAFGLSSALALTVAAAGAYPGQQYAKQASVTLSQALAIALRAVPSGKIIAQELDKEKGGLRYSFDIKIGGRTRELGIDAKTGRILENAVEGKNPD